MEALVEDEYSRFDYDAFVVNFKPTFDARKMLRRFPQTCIKADLP